MKCTEPELALIDRIMALPKEDIGDLRDMLACLQLPTDEEDLFYIRSGLIEIIENEPITVAFMIDKDGETITAPPGADAKWVAVMQGLDEAKNGIFVEGPDLDADAAEFKD